MRKVVLVVLMYLFFIGCVYGEETADDYTGLGVAVQSCEKALNKIDKDKLEIVYKTWLAGYLTAVNSLLVGKVDILKGKDMNEFYSVFIEYCDNNKKESVSEAAAALVNHLIKSVNKGKK